MNDSALRGTRNLLWRDIGFDLAVVVISAAIVWLCLRNPIFRVGAESFLLVMNALMIYDTHRRPQTLLASYSMLWRAFAGSTVFLVLSIGLQPLWRHAAMLYLGGQQEAAVRLFDANPAPSGYLVVVGGLAVYWSMVLLSRFTLIRLGILPNPYVLTWDRSKTESSATADRSNHHF